MPSPTIAFLGPEGTFAHFVAQQRFGKARRLVPQDSIKSVFEYVTRDPARFGVVPIENSSGGTIRGTVEGLTSGSYPLVIREALSVNVRLALLGKDKKNIRVIYSHFAPLQHCEGWLRTNFPKAEVLEEPSTASAAKKAAAQAGAAAIGNRDAAKRYRLKVLEFPIEKDSTNVTQFFLLGHERTPARKVSRTTLVAALPNRPGSLVDFLEPFKDAGVNLSRLISQPVIARPETYVFLVDITGSENDSNVRRALKKAASVALYLKNVGSYPVRPAYNS